MKIKPSEPRQPSCPICGEKVHKSYRPFCSKRCADIDLHRWFGEVYTIPAGDDPENGPSESDMNA